MIFYLGDKVEVEVEDKIRLAKNKAKSWAYGYNEAIDTVIISRDGTLGEVYSICGINIGLPEKPKHEDIINHNKTPRNQKWTRQDLPEGLNENTMYDAKYSEYIEREFERREKGLWIYINSHPIWIPGTYYYGIQWVKETTEYSNFRNIQNELMIFWEACKADDRCFGMQYVKNRRIGASYLAIIELLESGTINEDKILGIISKKGDDSKKIFNRLIKGFKRLPCFFQPLWDGTNTPKKELILDVPTKRRAKNEIIRDDGLGSSISWHNTEINAMDGDAIFRSLLDESGKYPPDVPFDKYWYIVKTSHTKGVRITGKSMVVSTVNAKKKGGAGYESIWNDSDVEVRDGNGQTKSGLYRIFIAAEYCLEGMFDEFGFTIIEDPKVSIKTDEGKLTKIGSKTWLKNKAESLKDDPEGLNEFKRQFPDTIRDAFRDESGECAFNLVKILEQIDHNEFELNETIYGNDLVERGNFSWLDGEIDTVVKWNPDPANGRFWIAKDCHPPKELRNLKTKKLINGVLAFAPVNEHIGCFGVDPYNRSKTVDSRGSKGSIHLSTKFNTGPFPNNAFILEYIDRPAKVELFFEDVLMAMVYYSMPMLAELSNEKFLSMIRDRGYRHFSLNNPFKSYKDLSATEKEYGGMPPQDTKIGEQQFFAMESYIQDHIGIARDNSEREEGTIGFMPFNRTLMQLKEVDPNNRTKFDAYISASLSRLGNQKKIKEVVEKTPIKLTSIFGTFDNSGNVSVPIR
jgi:hypothetical protein